jgi:hypothetical protein
MPRKKDKKQSDFRIPDSLLRKLFEFSGNKDGTRGIIFVATDYDGDPYIFQKADNTTLESGLKRVLETYLSSEGKEAIKRREI